MRGRTSDAWAAAVSAGSVPEEQRMGGPGVAHEAAAEAGKALATR